MNERNGLQSPGEPPRGSAKLVHLHTFYEEAEADFLRSALDAVGIDTYRSMNEGAGLFGRSVGIDIVVRPEDAQGASAILEELGIDPCPVPMTDPYAHIHAVREGLTGRFLRHPMIRWSVPILLLVGVTSLIASLVNGIHYLIFSR